MLNLDFLIRPPIVLANFIVILTSLSKFSFDIRFCILLQLKKDKFKGIGVDPLILNSQILILTS